MTVAADHRTDIHLSFPRLLTSEAIKLMTIRSTWWALGIAVAANVALAGLVMLFLVDTGAMIEAVSVIVGGSSLTMLIAGVLGVISVTGEYTTGMIRSTLTAEPRRGRVVVAKALVLAIAVALTTCVAYLASVVLTTVGGSGEIRWTEPSASVLPLLGGVLAMVSFALMGVGFGLIIRNAAGAIAVTVGVLFVLPVFVSLFHAGGPSWTWMNDLTSFLPASAAAQVVSLGPGENVGPAIVLFAWPVGLLATGAGVLRTRDA
ncbi:MAG: transporter permease [Microbacterium sp.]|jgi:ABC-2 type transport system permease protein|nr:transporter permease [Microbacterium sp.]